MSAWALALSSATLLRCSATSTDSCSGWRSRGLPPVGQLGAHGAGGVVGHGDAAALRFEEHVGVDVALAQAGQRADLLGVDLAAVTRQFDGAEAFADGAEGAAGLDLSQLPRVADADELAAGRGDVLGQALVFAGPDHARLVDQQHGAGREGLAAVEVGEQAGGVQRAHAGLLFERAGGQVAGRGAQAPGARRRQRHRRRPAARRSCPRRRPPRRSRSHAPSSSAPTPAPPARQSAVGCAASARLTVCARDDGHPLMTALGHRREQGLLGGQQRPGRVPQLVAAVGQRQRQLVAQAAGESRVGFQRARSPAGPASGR